MKRVYSIVVLFTLLLTACSDFFKIEEEEIKSRSEEVKTTITFDNSKNSVPVSVYSSSTRGVAIIKLSAGATSVPLSWLADPNYSFYMTYHIEINNVPIDYIPKGGNDITIVNIEEHKNTSVDVNDIYATLSSSELLTSDVYLSIKNNSGSGYSLYQGSTELKPQNNTTASNLINNNQTGIYKVQAGTVNSAGYKVAVNAAEKDFPSDPAQFEAGHIYFFTVNSGSTLNSNGDKEIILDNLDW